MASRKTNKGKETNPTNRETGRVTSPQEKKSIAHWTTENKELFIDLALQQIKIGNRPGKGFKAKSWKYIINGFKEKTSIT